MQDNEKYGIELEAKTSLFKKGLKEAVEYTKAFGKAIKESFGEEINKTANNWRLSFKELFTGEGYEKELETLQKRYKEIQGLNYVGKEDDLKYLESEIARVKELKNGQQEYNEELEETDKEATKTSSSLHSLFDKSIGRIKRFTYYLLGARSVFSLFMRYRSIYYQYNEEMQYQSELSQNAIALSLAPAFELLGNVIAYASIGFAKFIELLTGVNVLSKVTTKGIRDYNKSLKETQTLVSGIDEITNLTNPQNLGLASQYQALADFQEKIKEVEKFFSENKWISDLAKGLREVWTILKEKVIPIVEKFIEKIGGAKGALILLGGAVVMGAIGKLIGVAGVGATAGTGLAGVAGLLAFIGGLGVITITLYYKTEYDNVTEQRKEIASNYQSSYKEMLEFVEPLLKKSKTLNKNSKEYKDNAKKINEAWKLIIRSIQSGDSEVLKNKDDAEKLAKTLDNLTNTNYYTKTFKISEALGLDKAEDMSKSFWQRLGEQFTQQDKKDKERKQKYIAELNEYESKIDEIGDSLNGLNDIKIDDKNAKIKYDISADTQKADNKLTSLFKKFNIGELLKATGNYLLHNTMTGNILTGISKVISTIFTPHATGLDYVPYDNYPALLHKGEAVVPAKYNPSIHTESNDYTNSLLETLVYKVEDLASRPNVFEIDGQRFAQATYNLYDNERKKQGYIEGVIR